MKHTTLAEDLLTALESVQDRADEAAIVARLTHKYLKSPVTRKHLEAVAAHLGERVEVVARGLALAAARGRMLDERARSAVAASLGAQ